MEMQMVIVAYKRVHLDPLAVIVCNYLPSYSSWDFDRTSLLHFAYDTVLPDLREP